MDRFFGSSRGRVLSERTRVQVRDEFSPGMALTLSANNYKARVVTSSFNENKDILTRFLPDLRSKNEESRAKGAKDLRYYVESEAREMSSDTFNKYMEQLNKRIFDLVNSSDVNEKLSGIMVIDELLDVHLLRTLYQRFAHYLSMVFQQSGDQTDARLLKSAAHALGHLTRAGGTLAADKVEFELKRALEWLEGDRSEQRRHAAVLVLKELAENTPALFNGYVQTFLDHIWVSIRDLNPAIRLAAIEALRECLNLIAHRSSRMRTQRYHRIFQEILASFKTKKTEAIHGALLAIGEMLNNSGEFMLSRFKEVCTCVLDFMSHPDRLVRETVISLLPKLAHFEPEAFVRGYLDVCLKHIITILKSSSATRGTAYLALGEMALAVKSNIKPQLKTCVELVKEGLSNKRSKQFSESALTCLAMLAEATGSDMLPYMGDLVDQMFSSGLSRTLVEALKKLAKHIPKMLPSIQKQLLSYIKLYLTPAKDTKLNQPSVRPSKANPESKGDAAMTNLMSLALDTLGTFNFKNHDLLPFTRDVVLTYLEHPEPAIRKQAALTCGRLLLRPAHSFPVLPPGGPRRKREQSISVSISQSQHQFSFSSSSQLPLTFNGFSPGGGPGTFFPEPPAAAQQKVLPPSTVAMVSEVLERLLTVGIADPDPDIRRAVLESLDSRFDEYLGQAQNLHALFVALNDEVFKTREAAIGVIGRLAVRNPSVVLPSLRKTLMQLLSDLQSSQDSRTRDESSKLLGHLITSSRHLIKPYVGSILDVLVPQLRDADPSVASSVLATLGQLASIGGQDMVPHLENLIPIIITTLQDKSSMVKREVALRTLGELVESTGYVIEPYLQYPRLLPVVLDTLKAGHSYKIRKEVQRVLGILGALDPFQHKMNQMRNRQKRRGAASEGVDPILVLFHETSFLQPGVKKSSQEYFSAVAINALMRILREPGLSQHHSKTLEAVMYIVQSLGASKCVPFLPQIIPTFLHVMRTSEEALRNSLFNRLGVVVTIVKHNIAPYLDPGIFTLISDCWDPQSILLTDHILPLIEKIALALKDQFKVYLVDLMPKLLHILQTDRSTNRDPTLKVLHTLHILGPLLNDYLHLVIPTVLRLWDSIDCPLPAKRKAVITVGELCSKLSFVDFTSRIVHPLARLLAKSALDPADKAAGQGSLKEAALHTLCVLVHQLGDSYAIFVPMMQKVMDNNDIQSDRYNRLVNKLLQNADPTDATYPVDSGLNASGSKGAMRSSSSPNLRASNLDGSKSGIGRDYSAMADSTREDRETKVVERDPTDTSPPLDEADGAAKKLSVNQPNLKKCWEASQRSTREDWLEWMRGFSIELLKSSPSPAMRSCSDLGRIYTPLADELFNGAFVSCWTELYDQYQDDLVNNLDVALSSKDMPPELLQTLLNLAEFMEHDGKALPISIQTLGKLALHCHAYSKALHYKEAEFRTSPSTTVKALISINNQLGQPEAAVGILAYAKQHHSVELQESWYEKLQRWEDALEAYERRQLEFPQDAEATLGRMRCLKALGEWERLSALSQDLWLRSEGDPVIRAKTAGLAAAAAWNLGQWDKLPKYLEAMLNDDDDVQAPFFAALLAVHRGRFKDARSYIEQTRVILDPDLTALVGESYNRSYPSMVKLQQLAELEEIIRYQMAEPQQRLQLRQMWKRRLQGVQRNVDVWQEVLALRSLVVKQHQDLSTWLEFSEICREEGRFGMSLRVLTSLMGCDPSNKGSAAEVKEGRGKPAEQRESSFVLASEAPMSKGQRSIQALATGDSQAADLPLGLPQVCFAYLKHLWSAGFKEEAYAQLPQVIQAMDKYDASENTQAETEGLGSSVTGPFSRKSLGAGNVWSPNYGASLGTAGSERGGWDKRKAAAVSVEDDLVETLTRSELSKLKAEALLATGLWKLDMDGDLLNVENISVALSAFKSATQCDPTYEVWHSWAVMNYRVSQHYKNNSLDSKGGSGVQERGNEKRSSPFTPLSPTNSTTPGGQMRRSVTSSASAFAAAAAATAARKKEHHTLITNFVEAAIQGFFKSIALAGDRSLQDILRLLTLWFNHGQQKQIERTLIKGFGSISIDTWLAVVPQVIARIHTGQTAVRHMILDLLSKLGKAHPQALVYPLTVASKSANAARRNAANSVMSNLKGHSPRLVSEALMVSKELIRVAILWHEMWHEALEEASRLYFGSGDVEGMLMALEPLHQVMEQGPETLREVAFLHSYGRDLEEGREWCIKYKTSKNASDLNQAWDLYCNVFRKINKQLNQITNLELQYVSPTLLAAQDLELAVPGTYLTESGIASSEIIKIAYFVPSLKVIESKQRPRRISVMGSDGQQYDFLLKGHEDLRQDKRVMQLFGLVDTLLANDKATSHMDIQIKGYSVIPLAPNSGLIQWLHHCDTLHALIKEFRDARKVLLNIEHRLMLSMAPDYPSLTLMQKVEVFESALEQTTGQDLNRVLWLKSQNSEVWLDRRTNYTRSLGVMSMVGYILGLGDRHPCNLMLDRRTGKIIHIDFGDCFEVAMDREKFPEKIPFRLTRMLIQAMEVSGIEGNFRATAENVMRVLRANRESVMAVLEAFVYDPLINWRLLKTDKTSMHGEPDEMGGLGGKKAALMEDDVIASAAVRPGVEERTGKSTGKSLKGQGVAASRVSIDGQAVPEQEGDEDSEQINSKALKVLDRVQKKLVGRDFDPDKVLDYPAQVDQLIREASSNHNLCQCYIGWCPFW
eukprot:gb/GEZN01000061.1/.p1 GENE.gb/GEZN01000061.1/~~gb/GEZN01000061.1/.p1  ORF type:complete len:2707 (+),score=463.21 gb/GEZN01000061.1/:107-8227(+)